MYKVVQIWPGQTVTCLHIISPGHIWTTLYKKLFLNNLRRMKPRRSLHPQLRPQYESRFIASTDFSSTRYLTKMALSFYSLTVSYLLVSPDLGWPAVQSRTHFRLRTHSWAPAKNLTVSWSKNHVIYASRTASLSTSKRSQFLYFYTKRGVLN
jgi:hypothetical protein